MKQGSSGIWKLDKQDFILFIISALIQLLIIFSINFDFRNRNNIPKSHPHLFYQDSLLTLFSSKILFKSSLSQKTQETYSPSTPSSVFCNPLYFHSLLLHGIEFSYKKCLSLYYNKTSTQNYPRTQINRRSTVLAQNTLIFITSLFVCYSYKRLLTFFLICKRKIVSGQETTNLSYTNPFLLTILCLILPTQYSYQRCTCTSDSLFFGLLCLSFIFFNTSSFLSSVFFVLTFFLALNTRYEGFLLIFVFFVSLIYQMTRIFTMKINQTKYILCLCIKFVGIVSVTYLYYFRFVNYADRPFDFHDFLIHLLYPYSLQDGSFKMHYPFKALINQALTINTLRQAHSEFALFLPLLFIGCYFIVSKNPPNEYHSKSEQQSNASDKNPNQKDKKVNEKRKKQNEKDKKQNEKENIESHIDINNNNEFRFDITIDFYRQLGICILIFTVFASCFTNGAVYRILSFVQALAFPIVLEPLLNRFFIGFIGENADKTNSSNNKVEKLLCGLVLIVFFICIVVWDCLVARRETKRLNFQPQMWLSLSLN